jgi:hypothetical protein
MQHSDRDGSESSMNSDAFARRPALLAPPASPNLLTEEELSEEEAPAEQSVQPNNPSNNPSNNPLSFRPRSRASSQRRADESARGEDEQARRRPQAKRTSASGRSGKV